MTNEEAIKVLTEQLAYSDDVLPARLKEAYEVAIYSIEESKAIKERVVFYSNRPIEDIVLEARANAIDECIKAIDDSKSLFDNSRTWTMAEKCKLQNRLIQLKEKKE